MRLKLRLKNSVTSKLQILIELEYAENLRIDSKKFRNKYLDMLCFARFGTICIILKKWHRPMKETSCCNLTKCNTPPWVFLRF